LFIKTFHSQFAEKRVGGLKYSFGLLRKPKTFFQNCNALHMFDELSQVKNNKFIIF
jgi:hypothetical protein